MATECHKDGPVIIGLNTKPVKLWPVATILRNIMYDMLEKEKIINQKQMEIIRNSGTQVIVKNNNIEVIAYLYNDRVYVYDVKEINN